MPPRSKPIDVDHGRFDQFEPLGFERNTLALRHTDRGQAPGAGVFQCPHDMWWSHDPVGCQGGGGMRELQDRERVIALTDADRNRFTGQPLLFIAAQFPGTGRQHPRDLALKVDPGELAKAPGLHEIMNDINPQIIGHHVVVGIGRHHNRAVKVDRAITAGVRIAKFMPAKLEIARIVDSRTRRALAAVERSQRHEGLVSRAGRVGPAQRPVQQWLVGRLGVALPDLGIDAIRKKIWIKGGFADKCQNLTISWINCDQGTTALAEHVFDEFLQAQIDRQHHRGPR